MKKIGKTIAKKSVQCFKIYLIEIFSNFKY